jgi:poly-gamma-glutamate synthase PgsB/CapB
MTLPYISDVQLFLAVLISCACAVAWLGLSALAHHRRRNAVPVRVHVAGSRGKTTTTRMIGAGLRAAGMRVLVKTTGTDPMLILPDGSERPWPRWGPPTIAEQVRFFREARRLQVAVVVVESMAIEPEYLWASEKYLVRATHAAITNVRPDHAEVVGDHPLSAANAISLAIPRRGRLIIADEAAVEPILVRAAKLDCSVSVIPIAGLAHDDANKSLALAVCDALGVDRAIAGPALGKAGSDPGAFFVAAGVRAGKRFRFANAFSCNDPVSLRQLWEENNSNDSPIVLLNARDDRPARTLAFLEELVKLAPDMRLYLTGSVPRSWAVRAGFTQARIHRLRTSSPTKAVDLLVDAAGPDGMIWGVGNYSHLGRDIVRLLRSEGLPC